jgi:hypothetical protein
MCGEGPFHSQACRAVEKRHLSPQSRTENVTRDLDWREPSKSPSSHIQQARSLAAACLSIEKTTRPSLVALLLAQTFGLFIAAQSVTKESCLLIPPFVHSLAKP